MHKKFLVLGLLVACVGLVDKLYANDNDRVLNCEKKIQALENKFILKNFSEQKVEYTESISSATFDCNTEAEITTQETTKNLRKIISEFSAKFAEQYTTMCNLQKAYALSLAFTQNNRDNNEEHEDQDEYDKLPVSKDNNLSFYSSYSFSLQSVKQSLKSAIKFKNVLTGTVYTLAANTVLQCANSSFSHIIVPVLTQSYNLPLVGGVCKAVGVQVGKAAVLPGISHVLNIIGGGLSWYNGVPLLLLDVVTKCVYDTTDIYNKDYKTNKTLSRADLMYQSFNKAIKNNCTAIKDNYNSINSSISRMVHSHIVPVGVGALVLAFYIAAHKK